MKSKRIMRFTKGIMTASLSLGTIMVVSAQQQSANRLKAVVEEIYETGIREYVPEDSTVHLWRSQTGEGSANYKNFPYSLWEWFIPTPVSPIKALANDGTTWENIIASDESISYHWNDANSQIEQAYKTENTLDNSGRIEEMVIRKYSNDQWNFHEKKKVHLSRRSTHYRRAI